MCVIVVTENMCNGEEACWHERCNIFVLCHVCYKCTESCKNQLWGQFFCCLVFL